MESSAVPRRPRRSVARLVVTALVVTGVIPLLAPTTAGAAGFVVDTLSDNPADGLTLREAIDAANLAGGHDVIEFADDLTGTLALDGGHFDVNESLTIVGPGSDQLTIDAQLASRVFHSFTPGTELLLSGMTLTRGLSVGFGGAIAFHDGKRLSLDDVVITGSSAPDGGAVGAVDVQGEVRIVDSVLNTNSATVHNGGALFVETAHALVIHDSEFVDNEAPSGEGGGIWVETEALSVRGSTFERNRTGVDGGGLHVGSSTIEILDSTLIDNEAGKRGGGARLMADVATLHLHGVDVERNTADQSGGGVHASSLNGDIRIAESTFADNTGGDAGGALLSAPNGEVTVRTSSFDGNRTLVENAALTIDVADSAVVDQVEITDTETGGFGALHVFMVGLATVSGSTIADNVSGGDGAAIHAFDSTVRVLGSTVADNVAGGDGGAIFASDSDVQVSHSTIVSNVAAGEGGAFAWKGPGAGVALHHGIAWGNTAPNGPLAAGSMSIDWSYLDDTADLTIVGGDNTVGVDPLLGPLGDHGGPTSTHRPEPSSPVIDAGNPVLPGAPGFDQRGSDRLVGVVDIGAVEIQEEERPLWIPVAPARLLDTRDGAPTIDGQHVGGGPVTGGRQVEVAVAGRAGIPDDAAAIIVNMTAVDAVGNGFAVAHACLDQRPTAAGLNYTAGVNLGNEVIAGLDDSGALCVFVRTTAHVVLDVVGYVPADSAYEPIDPSRLLETRPDRTTVDGLFNGTGKPGEAGEIELRIAGRGGVADTASAAVLYVAAVDAPAAGFIVGYDCDGPRPTASSLNHVAGVNRGNEVVVPLSDDGTICIFTRRAVDVTVDVVGYVPDVTEFTGLDQPSRLFETRSGQPTIDGQSEGAGPIGAGDVVEVQVAGRAGIPETATTVAMNVTAIAAPANGNLVVYACGEQPLAASLNYVTGVNGGNEVIAGLSPDGTVCIRSLRSIDLTLDVSGYTARLDAISDSSGKAS